MAGREGMGAMRGALVGSRDQRWGYGGAGLEQEPDKNASFITRNHYWIPISKRNGRTRDSPTKKR